MDYDMSNAWHQSTRSPPSNKPACSVEWGTGQQTLDREGFLFKSPISALATDMDMNWSLRNGSQMKTPRRCLLKDLTSLNKNAEDKTSSSKGLSRTKTAFGRLQGSGGMNLMDSDSDTSLPNSPILSPQKMMDCMDDDSSDDLNANGLNRSFTIQNKPPLAPLTLLNGMNTSKNFTSGVSHWNQRSNGSNAIKKPLTLTRHQSVNGLGFPIKKKSSHFESDKMKDSMEFPLAVENTNCIPTEIPHILPFIPSNDNLCQITPETLLELIDGVYNQRIDSYCIIDCRYSYEYQGGHVQGAENISTPNALEARFFDRPTPSSRQIIVFHCEYSLQRAPRMALYFRSKDRKVNMMNYPNLYYPQMYILKGGYRDFYSKFKDKCDPKAYIEMTDESFKDEYKRESNVSRPFRKCFSEGFL